MMNKRAVFMVMGLVGGLLVVSGFATLATEQSFNAALLARLAVGAFLIGASYKKLKKKVEKYFIKQIKTDGDEPGYFGPFSDMMDLNLWYSKNKDAEEMQNVEVVKG